MSRGTGALGARCVLVGTLRTKRSGEEPGEPSGRCRVLFICSFSKNLPLMISSGPGPVLCNARDTPKTKGSKGAPGPEQERADLSPE